MKDMYPKNGLSEVVEFLCASIGREIKSRRKAFGISQKALSRSSGVRIETVSRIENGYKNPTLKTVQKLLKATEKFRK